MHNLYELFVFISLGKIEEDETTSKSLIAALVAVSVVAVVVITVLSLLLARFVYLYRRRKHHMFGDGNYTPYNINSKL